MGKLQDDKCLPDGRPPVDRRRHTLVGRAQRLLIDAAHSKWVASFIVAFAVSWCFHQVDEVGQHRIERQQRVIKCTFEGVANAQLAGERAHIGPILQHCDKQLGK